MKIKTEPSQNSSSENKENFAQNNINQHEFKIDDQFYTHAEYSANSFDDNLFDEPQAIKETLPKVIPFDIDKLPHPFRTYVRDISERMQCSPDYIAIALITLIGSIIGSRCGIKPKARDDWKIVPNVWGAVVGDPSQMKTPSTKEVIKLLKPLEMAAMNQFKEDHKSYLGDTALHEEKVKQIKKLYQDKQGTISKEELSNQLKQLAANPPIAPVLIRYILNDATQEKLADVCSENQKGLLLYRDELVGLLMACDKPGNEHQRPFYLESWNGLGGYTVDRVGKGTKHIECLCLSVFGCIVPDRLKIYLQRLMKGENDGLLQRFQLMVYPDQVNFTYVDRYPDHEAKKVVSRIITYLVEKIVDFTQYGAENADFDQIPYFRFSSDAQLIFIDWLNELETTNRKENSPPFIKEHFTKYRSLMPSLALIFHLINVAQSPKLYNGDIKKESAELASWWCNYLKSHVFRIYEGLGNLHNGSTIELSKRILKRDVKDNFNSRDIYRKEWHLLSDKNLTMDAINDLVDANWIIPNPVVTNATGRPPAITYKINPRVYKSPD